MRCPDCNQDVLEAILATDHSPLVLEPHGVEGGEFEVSGCSMNDPDVPNVARPSRGPVGHNRHACS